MSQLVEIWECPKCGKVGERSLHNKHMCVDCEKAENSRYSYLRNNQGDWMIEAEEQDIKVWDQQPGETQWEYTVWQAYRACYPGKKPSYSEVAEELGTTSNVVRKIAQRWTFQARMQAWITECSRNVEVSARAAIMDMNMKQIDIASALQDKIGMAVDQLDPASLRPGEIATLMKASAEMERKARVDDLTQSALLTDLTQGPSNSGEKVAPTKQGDINEVLRILQSAGALPGTLAGVKTTTTTEVVVKAPEEDTLDDN